MCRPGLNIEGLCITVYCKAYKQMVIGSKVDSCNIYFALQELSSTCSAEACDGI